MIVGIHTAAHADCVGSICLTDEQVRSNQTGTELTLQRRIENALSDLEIDNARASTTNLEEGGMPLEIRIERELRDLDMATTRILRTDQERRKMLLRKSGIER